jgi:hypothetical protein
MTNIKTSEYFIAFSASANQIIMYEDEALDTTTLDFDALKET